MLQCKNAIFVMFQHSFDEARVNRTVFNQQNMNRFFHEFSY